MAYDNTNIFAKILRGEIPNDTVQESDYTLAFRDIAPQRPTHILIIPKGAYISFNDFSQRATDIEVIDFIRMVGEVARLCGITEDGYRLISNIGRYGHQEVPHFHMHILGGAETGPMIHQ